jgi:ABC-2 type transport system permease protein
MRWSRVVSVARRHYWVVKRSPHRTFDVLLWPVVDALTFGSLAAAYQRGSSLAYVLAGIVLWHVMYQAQIALSTGFLEETWSRNLMSLMATPVREVEYIAGVALFGLAKLVVGVAAVAATAAVGYAFDVTSLGWGLVLVAALLMLAGWLIALLVIGLVLRFGSGAEALAWGVLFVIMPLSGTFFPVEALPGPLQQLALVLPTTHAFEAARVLVDGERFPAQELARSAALTCLLAVAALSYAVAMLRTFRRRGFVTRYA